MAEAPPQPLQVHLPNSQTQPHSITISTTPSSFSHESSPPPPPPPPPEQPSQPPRSFGLFSFQKRPPVRVTSEFDSDSSIFVHKLSSKLFNGLTKLKFSFQNDPNGKVSEPQLAIITKHLAIHYDFEEQNALVKGSLNVGPNLKLEAAHDIKARQGELTMVANLSDPDYKIKLASAVPSIGLPKATLKFPYGEVSLEEKEDDEEKRILSVSGVVESSVLNGVCSALYKDETLNLRYCYKDEEMSFIPSISLPSNAVSFAFKRRFGPSDKLSYWYNFDTNYWSAVYKHTVGTDYKFKAGYDSEVRLGWASLWVGDEDGTVKTAPMKMKVQFMLQVPQDDIKASALMFRVKKRWDM